MKTKTSTFSPQTLRLAELAKALGHPARIEIIKYLAGMNSCVCGDIVDALPLSQSTVSQHLKVLKQAGLIQGNIEGPRVCYCIDQTNLEVAREVLQEFLQLATSTDETCAC
ncbi:MAG: metalloregulator ArsR/SmtB family transcription factor [Bacteroidota bacterium]